MPHDSLQGIVNVYWAAPEKGILWQNGLNLIFDLLANQGGTWGTLIIDAQISLNCLIIVILLLGDVFFHLAKFSTLQILLQNSQKNKLKRQLAKENKSYN
jgi:hypothetical protein